MARIETDYLVVGAGAGGLAFADSLAAETDASITIVDERARPGGHWNDAYGFVRLHQPSAFYGVNSLPLGVDAIDAEGLNAGYYELATGVEVCAYFERVMEGLLARSGRIQYFPMHRFTEGQLLSLATGTERDIRVRKKIVDATYVAGAIPSLHTPAYEIASGVRHVPVNELTDLNKPEARYVIIGAGKTGIDACLFLLAQGVAPNQITWIAPQDAWLFNRALNQPGEKFLERVLTGLAVQMEAAATAATVDDVFARLEAAKVLFRIDPAAMPSAYRCATVTEAELEQLRRIQNIVRMGRVRRIEPHRMLLDSGEFPIIEDALYVDCSAKGVAPRPVRPIFLGERITLQFVRLCQPAFSAAFIAFVEAHYEDETKKNALCGVIPSPERAIDWLSMTLKNAVNSFAWMQEPQLMEWLARSRLNGFSGLLKPSAALTAEQNAARQRLRAATPGAVANLQRLLGSS